MLPFENLGPADEDYFVDGITDEIRGRLTGLPALRVTSRSSSSQYRKTTKSPQELGQELGVQYLLTGTVRWDKSKDGAGRIKVSPELIVVSTGASKWQESFDASISDVFQVQADVAGRVAQALNVALTEPAKQQLAEKPTANLAAYDAYLRGRSYELRSRLNVEPQLLPIARDMYRQAIAADSGFALAWAGLADVSRFLYRRDPSDRESRELARRAAERAVALAPAAAETHLALGDILDEVEHDKNARESPVRHRSPPAARQRRGPQRDRVRSVGPGASGLVARHDAAGGRTRSALGRAAARARPGVLLDAERYARRTARTTGRSRSRPISTTPTSRRAAR